MELSRARDLHSVIKHSGGLNYSVGFMLEDFDVNEKAKPGEPWLLIKRGDLTEVSIVTFPACAEAQMDLKSRSLSPSQSRALADWNAFVSRADASNAAIMRKVVEIRLAIRKRDRDAETERAWRHEYVDGPRGRLNI
jgi:Caudovirus prohead serine protease